MAKFLELKQNVNTYQVIEVEIHMEILEMNLMEHTEFSLLRLKFFLAWLETFFSWKCAMTLSSSSKLCTELSQIYWEAARVNERDVQLLFTGRREAKRRNSSAEMKMNVVVSFSRKFYQFFPWIWRALTIFLANLENFSWINMPESFKTHPQLLRIFCFDVLNNIWNTLSFLRVSFFTFSVQLTSLLQFSNLDPSNVMSDNGEA